MWFFSIRFLTPQQLTSIFLDRVQIKPSTGSSPPFFPNLTQQLTSPEGSGPDTSNADPLRQGAGFAVLKLLWNLTNSSPAVRGVAVFLARSFFVRGRVVPVDTRGVSGWELGLCIFYLRADWSISGVKPQIHDQHDLQVDTI